MFYVEKFCRQRSRLNTYLLRISIGFIFSEKYQPTVEASSNRVIGAFPNDASLLRLAVSILMNINEE